VNAQEFFRIQLRLKTADRFAQKIGLGSVMNAHIVAFGLDAVNVFDVEEEDAARGFDNQPLNVSRSRL
jgi:hypothetical protein